MSARDARTTIARLMSCALVGRASWHSWTRAASLPAGLPTATGLVDGLVARRTDHPSPEVRYSNITAGYRPVASRASAQAHGRFASPSRPRHFHSRVPTQPLRSSMRATSHTAPAREFLHEAWRRRGLEGSVELGPREVPAAMPVDILSLEFLVHAWDFATATGRHVVISEPLADYALDQASKVITPEARGFAGFADSVETAPDASLLDRLIGFRAGQPAVVQTSAN